MIMLILPLHVVSAELRRLHVAFPNNIGMRTNPTGTAEVYRSGLIGIAQPALTAAVDRAIQDGKFFPKIAELRELAATWARHNQPSHAIVVAADPLYCPNCHSKAYYRDRWRPVRDKLLRPILSVDRTFLLLEPYQRLLCDCAAPCVYSPVDDLQPPMMRVGPTLDAAAPHLSHDATNDPDW
jgi:hypothetical protein